MWGDEGTVGAGASIGGVEGGGTDECKSLSCALEPGEGSDCPGGMSSGHGEGPAASMGGQVKGGEERGLGGGWAASEPGGGGDTAARISSGGLASES